MKKILIILLSLSLSACTNMDDLPQSLYTVDMEYITGSHQTLNYKLPTNGYFTVRTSQGSYYMRFVAPDAIGSRYIKSGVINYKIIKKVKI